MHVRRAHSKVALTTVRALDRLCFPLDAPYRTAGADWWLAFDDEGDPVGYSGVKYLASAGLWFMCRIGVLPSARGRGLAKRLTAVRLRHIAQNGGGEVVTYCLRDNLPSANNLISHGFKLYEPEEFYGGEDDLYWSRHV